MAEVIPVLVSVELLEVVVMVQAPVYPDTNMDSFPVVGSMSATQVPANFWEADLAALIHRDGADSHRNALALIAVVAPPETADSRAISPAQPVYTLAIPG
jgi:hypothetical protein